MYLCRNQKKEKRKAEAVALIPVSNLGIQQSKSEDWCILVSGVNSTVHIKTKQTPSYLGRSLSTTIIFAHFHSLFVSSLFLYKWHTFLSRSLSRQCAWGFSFIFTYSRGLGTKQNKTTKKLFFLLWPPWECPRHPFFSWSNLVICHHRHNDSSFFFLFFLRLLWLPLTKKLLFFFFLLRLSSLSISLCLSLSLSRWACYKSKAR